MLGFVSGFLFGIVSTLLVCITQGWLCECGEPKDEPDEDKP